MCCRQELMGHHTPCQEQSCGRTRFDLYQTQQVREACCSPVGWAWRHVPIDTLLLPTRETLNVIYRVLARALLSKGSSQY